MESTLGFSDRVENYVRYRPDYPAKLIDTLIDTCPLNKGLTVADIGSGTGIFTQRLLARGLRVTAVEPNNAMSETAESLLPTYESFSSVYGSAEHSHLENKSVDLIVAAQAFHWFDFDKALREFERILKLTGLIALVWNECQLTSGFHHN
jgi:ubiquinone/menaquinone biosynthesis C-methylase UbiE